MTSRAQQEVTGSGAWSFCEEGLLADDHDCGLRESLLATHTSWGHSNPSQRPQRVGTNSALTLCHTPECQSPLEGSFTCTWYPGFVFGALVFVTAAQGMPIDHLPLVASEAYATVSQDCIYLNTFKS